MNDLEVQFEQPHQQQDNNALVQSNEARAVAEVQSAFVIAKKFPRNQHESYQNIIAACKRPTLAEQAMYTYKRGTTIVNGPSIRLAEAIAQSWGNIDCGVQEVSQSNGVSVAEAYAIDLQTNVRIRKIFHVKHERHTKKGKTKLTDPRDIYEMVANQGARRLRACILGVIPSDVVESAVNQVKKTLMSSEVPLEERIKRMVEKFDELGVKVEHLEKFLCHNLNATIPEELVTLQGVYKSIKDGVAKRDDFFEISKKAPDDAAEELEGLIEKNKAQSKPSQETKLNETKDDKKS